MEVKISPYPGGHRPEGRSGTRSASSILVVITIIMNHQEKRKEKIR
jgi:hypothetical protein